MNDTAVGLPMVLNENGPDGNIDYAYGWGLLESSSAGFNYFYNLDGLGSVTNLTDATGKVQETYSYDAWGNALTAQGSVGTQNKFRFTGQALDPATGLYFLRARYYDQTGGRLLSKDSFPGFAALPITLHRYIYVGNNPVKWIDPSGLQGVEPPEGEGDEGDPFEPYRPNNPNDVPRPMVPWKPSIDNFAHLMENIQDSIEQTTAPESTGAEPSSCSSTSKGSPSPSLPSLPLTLPWTPNLSNPCATGQVDCIGPDSGFSRPVLQRCIGLACFPL